MRNKSIILLVVICAAMALCPARLYAAESKSDTLKDASEGGPAQDEANISDLQDADKGITLLQDKFRKREYNLKKNEEYEKIQTTEMNKCGELKKEIWKLRDNAKALAAKLKKLTADKSKAEAREAAQAETYKAREKEIRAAENEISAGDKQFERLAAAGEKEKGERKERISKLKESLKSSADKIEALTSEKNKADDDLKAKDAEYKAETDKLEAIKYRPALEKKEGASPAKKGASAKEETPVDDGSAEIKKKMDELMVIAQGLEASSHKLSEEISAATVAKRSQEEEIKALENDDALKAKDLKARSEDLGKGKKSAQVKIEKLKKKALSSKFKMQAAVAGVKKLDDGIKKAAQEKRRAEKALIEKTNELKVRISVLLGRYDESDLPKGSNIKAPIIKEGASRGEELGVKLDRIFETIKDENDRLMAENKKIQVKLQRAEKTATAAKRKAEEAVKAPEELKSRLNKERLDMHFNLAIVYEKNGLWQDAEREYLKCLRIDPKDPGVHYNLGILYDDKLNRNNKAMYHYYKFLSLRPMGETAERVRDWITKLELENRLGKEMR